MQALMDPDAYPQATSNVDMIETHISFIFFTSGYAYKVKKPVDYGFLDFTTLEKRRHFCEREVALNQRICPEVYLGVEEIRDEAGRYAVGGPGQTVEYAVKMRRLPPENSMERLLQEDGVSVQDVERIAARIAWFHREAETGSRITAFGDLRAVSQNVEENFAQTREFVGRALSKDIYDDLAAYSRAFMEVRGPVFPGAGRKGMHQGLPRRLAHRPDIPGNANGRRRVGRHQHHRLHRVQRAVPLLRRQPRTSPSWPWIWTSTAGPTCRAYLR